MTRSKFFVRCFFILFINVFLYSQNPTHFKHLTLKYNGKRMFAPESLQDPNGILWFSTVYGVLKYDGYDFSFVPTEQIFNTSHQQKLIDISKDSEGNIWLTSNQGKVSRYLKGGKFEQIETDSIGKVNKVISVRKNVFFIINNNEIYEYSESGLKKIIKITGINDPSEIINSLVLDNNDKLYIASSNGKLFSYSLYSKELENIKNLHDSYPGILNLVIDTKDNLWIGTASMGLLAYDTKNKKFFENKIFKLTSTDLSNEIIYSMFCDHEGNIWIGTDGSGLYKIDPEYKSIYEYAANPNNKHSLSSNTILSINEDNKNNLWIHANSGDINILPDSNPNIHYYTGSDNDRPQRVLSIYKSSNNEIWIGTDGNGLTRIIPESFKKDRIIRYFNKNERKKNFYIQSIAEDEQGDIWIGTYKNGLWVMNKKTQRFKKIKIKNINNKKANDIRTIFIDSKNRIWVGSEHSIVVFSEDQNVLAQFEYNKQGLKGIIAESFIEDNRGNILTGVFMGGLFKCKEDPIDLQNSGFEKMALLKDKHFNYKEGVTDMIESKGAIWLINPDGILLHYRDNKTTSYENFKSFKKLQLVSIEKDKNDNLWMGTSNGIIFFNPKDTIVTKYNETDGLQNNRFMSRSSFRDKDGMLYFGNHKGVNYFDPLKLKKKKSKIELHISSIEILNKPGDKIVPEQFANGINNIEHLYLKNNQSSFSFKFAAIDNILDPNFYYAYRLKGFDKDWISNTPNQIATYTNIPPGEYTFEVKAGNGLGEWNIPQKNIKVTIEKPWWNHPLLYAIILSILLLIIYLGYRWFNLRKKMITKELIHKKENELNNLKMDFFTKMSHEIQTPLSIISAPLEDMIDRSKKNGDLLLNQRLNIIAKNTKRLSKIAFELTTLRNRELNQLRLRVKKNNLYDEVHQISLSFKEESRIKKIDFTTNCPKNLTDTWYDKDKIEHVIYNLLSNAFKFTPKNGNIQLNIIPIESKDKIKISITDSGPGIPKDELNEIFTLFYQSEIGKKTKGTGIGLTLTKELIDLHRGEITVTSDPENGTCFTIILPIAEKYYSDSEKIMTEATSDKFEQSVIEDQKDITENPFDKSKTTILVVEDDFDLRTFLKDLLKEDYNILLASNGEEGLEYAKKHLPDLILSDIMMPKMDGIEMCNLLQKNSQTNHIPIILITAKNSTNSKIQGLKSGAVEYIHKPFNTTELQLTIKNILSSREHIITRFKKETISNPNIKISKTQDEIFLENLVSEINEHLDDTSFKMEELADALNMSYSTLYRKCQAITGNNLVDFIRLIRLKKGAVIIAKYGYTISESSFMVGFNDPKYFSKCFKKEFGVTPKQFKKEADEIGLEKYLKKYNLEEHL